MVKNSKQNWTVGATVKVGFFKLVVQAAIATPGDGLPDVYFLTNLAGDKLYEFVPHHGLTATTLDEVERKVAAYRAHIERIAAEATTRAAKASKIRGVFNDLFAEVA